eukprot:16234-Heterococcus_DN1.PRE.5
MHRGCGSGEGPTASAAAVSNVLRRDFCEARRRVLASQVWLTAVLQHVAATAHTSAADSAGTAVSSSDMSACDKS